MKTPNHVFTLIILFALAGNIFAQNENNERSIDSLFAVAEKFKPVFSEGKFSCEITDSSELEKVRRLLYNSLSNNPHKYYKKLLERTEEWKQDILSGKLPRLDKPAAKIGYLKEAVANIYGWDYVRFMEAPYFMKVKVLDLSSDTYVSGSRGLELDKINIKAQILDIVKSTDEYSVGDTITVSYLPFWFRNSSPPSFNTGNTYAFPMKNWGGINNVDKENELELNLVGLHTFYKIKNDTLISPLAPEYNSSKSWESFKKEFRAKYMID